MRAITVESDTATLSVAEVPDPTPGPGEVLIEVAAAGVNRADLAQAAGKYPPPPGASELPGLEVGKFDIVIAPVTVTAERLERYTFTPPIADATVSLVKAASNKDLTKPEDIKGKTVGIQKGTAQEKQLEAYAEKLGGFDIKGYGSPDEAYADLAAGRLDAVAGSAPNLAYLAKTRPDVFETIQPPFGEPKYFAWVTRKEG